MDRQYPPIWPVEGQGTAAEDVDDPGWTPFATVGEHVRMSTPRERMLAGEQYLADDPELQEMNLRARELTDAYNASSTLPEAERRRLLEELLGSVGEGVTIRPPLRVDYGQHLHVGAGTFANFGLVALDCARITIGEHVQIGPNVQLLPPTHPLDPVARREGWESADPITIGDNVWLGGGVIVVGGVTIGQDSVIGAGSVVTKDVPAGVVAVGSPARVVRSLEG